MSLLEKPLRAKISAFCLTVKLGSGMFAAASAASETLPSSRPARTRHPSPPVFPSNPNESWLQFFAPRQRIGKKSISGSSRFFGLPVQRHREQRRREYQRTRRLPDIELPGRPSPRPRPQTLADSGWAPLPSPSWVRQAALIRHNPALVLVKLPDQCSSRYSVDDSS